MSLGIAIDKKSFAALKKNLKKFGKLGTDAIEEAILDATKNTHADAVRAVPVDKGRLKDSIHPVITRAKVITGEVSTNVLYSSYVEFGTQRQKAQPYLWPAFEVHSRMFETYANRAMQKAIERNW